MTDIDQIFMQQAIRQAMIAAEKDEVPVGAVIVNGSQLIAKAHNQVEMLKDPTAHAEMIAITQAAAYLKNERLNGCILYATIEPCSMCVGAAVLARLKAIVFGANDPKTGACGSAIDLTKEEFFNHTFEVTSGILEPECRTIIQEFFLKKR